MPRCQNCNGYVTQNYVRVFALDETTGVGVCPRCETETVDGE